MLDETNEQRSKEHFIAVQTIKQSKAFVAIAADQCTDDKRPQWRFRVQA